MRNPRKIDRLAAALPKQTFDAAEFKALLNAAVDGIIVTDRSGAILRFNHAAEKMLGYRAEEILGQPIKIIMNARDGRAHGRYMDRYLETGKKKIIGIGREVLAKCKDGSNIPVSLSIGEARIGDELRFVGLIRDLSAEQKAEEAAMRHREQLNHTGRLSTMGEMAAAMAHEINQPLSAISNYTAACARLLERDDGNKAEVLKALGEIGRQAHRAAEVVRRIRSFARSDSKEHELIGIETLIGEVLPLVRMDAKANHTVFKTYIAKNLPDIRVNRVEIQQVILNLLRNGVDAMQDVPEQHRRLDLRVSQLGTKEIEFSITDRGHGVSEDVANKLFTPFFTTKKSGMGMGLAISRSIVDAHGGTLRFSNNPVEGACFCLNLPINTPSRDKD